MSQVTAWDQIEKLEKEPDPVRAAEQLLAFVRLLAERGLLASQQDRTGCGLRYPSPYFLLCDEHPHRWEAWSALHDYALSLQEAP